MSGISQQER